MTAADRANTACQPSRSSSRLETGRDSMMPSISPLMTLPTTRPRLASGARCAAYGTRTCTATEPMPMNSEASRNGSAAVDTDAASSARMATHRTASTSRLVSTRSPSGTTSSRPVP